MGIPQKPLWLWVWQLASRASTPSNIPLLTSDNTFTGVSTFSGAMAGAGFPQTKTKLADQTVADTVTLANDDSLSVSLAAGSTYVFRVVYYATTVATSGIKIDLGGGSATATSVIVNARIIGNVTLAILAASVASSLSTTLGFTTIGDTAVRVEIEGTITVNAAGTFVPRFAQNAETIAGESVIARRGSYMTIAPVTA